MKRLYKKRFYKKINYKRFVPACLGIAGALYAFINYAVVPICKVTSREISKHFRVVEKINRAPSIEYIPFSHDTLEMYAKEEGLKGKDIDRFVKEVFKRNCYLDSTGRRWLYRWPIEDEQQLIETAAKYGIELKLPDVSRDGMLGIEEKMKRIKPTSAYDALKSATWQEYRVKKNDNLWNIARKNNPYSSVLSTNDYVKLMKEMNKIFGVDIVDVNKLQIGQTIYIPKRESCPRLEQKHRAF